MLSVGTGSNKAGKLQKNIECILSYVLRIVFSSILRVALSSRLAPSLKLTALMRVFGFGGILPEACWLRRPFNTCFKNIPYLFYTFTVL